MTLLALQRSMRDVLLTDDEAFNASEPGMNVYRNNYRAQLLGALQTSFELTRKWAGEEAFDAAARHYVLLNPTSSWTLDDYGAGFDKTLHALFANDPDVAELAWLEWHMSQAFASVDGPVLGVADLTSGPLGDADWQEAALCLISSFAMREIDTACVPLWLAMRDQGELPTGLKLQEKASLIVWRKDLSPHFRIIGAAEHMALSAIADGRSFESICTMLAAQLGDEASVEAIGTMFGAWLSDGLLADVQRPA